MTSDFLTFWHFFSGWIHFYLRRWTKPATVSIIFGSLSDMQRSRTELIAENALLRQQLSVLNRQVKPPHLNHRDRIGLVLHSRFTKNWKQAIHIVQAGDIWACDFTVVYDLLFRPIFIFVILELKTRLVIHSAVTRPPTDEWTAKELREAAPWDLHPTRLIRDHDRKYGALFSSLAASSGIQEVKTPYQAPEANAICERFIGSAKRECLDHMLVLNQRQLEPLVKDYVNYYNQTRPHQSIHQRIPDRYRKKEILTPIGKIVSRPVLNGLHHEYTRTAYLNWRFKI